MYCLGLNYKSAPMNIRKEFTFNDEQNICALKILNNLNYSAVIISTCNRMEIYFTSENKVSKIEILDTLCKIKKPDENSYENYFYFFTANKAEEHLFKVASGLDSNICGEDQILGQVKKAAELSRKNNFSNEQLNLIFDYSIKTAKYIKTNTKLSNISLSVGTIAADIIKKTYPEYKNITAMIIGTGQAGTITIKNLKSLGIKKIYATNRKHGLKADINFLFDDIDIIDYDNRYEYLNECDVIISCTLSPHFTLNYDEFIKNHDRNKKLVIDFAVPKDIDAKISKINEILFYDIEGFDEIINENNELKKHEIDKANDILKAEISKYYSYINLAKTERTIKKIENFKKNLIKKTLTGIKSDTNESSEILEYKLEKAFNQILGKTIYSVKANAKENEILDFFNSIDKYFE